MDHLSFLTLHKVWIEPCLQYCRLHTFRSNCLCPHYSDWILKTVSVRCVDSDLLLNHFWSLKHTISCSSRAKSGSLQFFPPILLKAVNTAFCGNAHLCPITTFSFSEIRMRWRESQRLRSFPTTSLWCAPGDGWSEPHPKSEKMKLSLDNITKQLWALSWVLLSQPALRHITCTQTTQPFRWNQCVVLSQPPLHFHTLNLDSISRTVCKWEGSDC